MNIYVLSFNLTYGLTLKSYPIIECTEHYYYYGYPDCKFHYRKDMKNTCRRIEDFCYFGITTSKNDIPVLKGKINALYEYDLSNYQKTLKEAEDGYKLFLETKVLEGVK